jgi:hypothetical protein
MKFRIIEDQRETFPVRVLCDVMGVSTAVGAAGPKVRARRPIVLCSPRSGFSIWPIAGAMAGQESMRPCPAWGTRRAVAGLSGSCAITVSRQ